jgi:hypothetical protein
MYDVNPLGPQMHLRELERRAVPSLRPDQLRSPGESRLTALRARMFSIISTVVAVAAPAMQRGDSGP